MKKRYIFLVLLALTLGGCAAKESEVKDDIEDDTEEQIDLSLLPYYSFLNDANPVVTITVEGIGKMKLQLFPDVAKLTVDNFITYIQKEKYTDSIFHRVIQDFMIQGGIVSKTDCPIKGEFSSNGVENLLLHDRGVISMARTSVKDSATSQFFIVHKQSSHLNGSYAAFGGLISGFDVLDIIASTPTGTADKPAKDIIITSITVALNGYVVGEVTCVN